MAKNLVDVLRVAHDTRDVGIRGGQDTDPERAGHGRHWHYALRFVLARGVPSLSRGSEKVACICQNLALVIDCYSITERELGAVGQERF